MRQLILYRKIWLIWIMWIMIRVVYDFIPCNLIKEIVWRYLYSQFSP
jgi:hypothetical protein